MTGPQHGGESELALMRRVASSDEAAVAELYDRFGALVFRMALQAMPTRADAEDAVQEVFVRLWRTAERYDPDRAALVTWVMLIARRHLVDRLRRTRARVRTTGLDASHPGVPSEVGVAAPNLESQERLRSLERKIAKLPDLQRAVVTRAYFGGQTLRQIGEEMHTPIGTIKSALSRALVRLRETTTEELST
ncbi:MAG: sigma-70 family RNA polymerase sigma factor [Phycisphaerae bacterium]|nr:sigma-70 family RNA polymerase sigma factor [Phycisphaerae bacterium]